MMDVQIGRCDTDLAAPPVSLEHLILKRLVFRDKCEARISHTQH